MDIENLRQELYKFINKYGLSDARTIKKSKQLDKALNKKLAA
jgi:hypothetical protein